MINVSLALRNPWSQRFRSIMNRHRTISAHKTLELSVYQSNCILEFSINVTGFRQDHVGVHLDLGLLGYTVDLSLYDHRHAHEL